MHFTTLVAALLPVLAVSAQTTHTVLVGNNQGLTYEPSSVNASVGDTIEFQFISKNHTVTQSTFAAPCENMTTPTAGIDSGFMPVSANATGGQVPAWSFTLNNASAPLWFYCRQTGHCQKGMVFAVNPTAAKSFEAFQAAAMGNSSTASGSASGSTASSTSGGSAAGSSSTPSASANGALKLGSGAAGILTISGLVAGLLL
ncbi:hypothetical protein PLICRDRAFT_40770 [Plicaturopsis crispa FD-325 SS-3]|nr:hypothetical protein PLICRDRAFT_40770 [Plicaturopsis crispa FD-325 SS-3]